MNDLAMIVLNYNSGQDATICVKKLLKAYESLRIVIVDNCSTDGSYEVLREHFRDAGTVDVIQAPGNAGYSAGNNYGMKYAIGKYGVRYLGIANPDVIIDNPDLLPRMLRFLESHPDCGVIGGATQDPDGVFDIRKAAWNIPTPFRLVTDHLLFVRRKQLPVSTPIEDRFVRVDCIAGCFFLTTTAFMEKIGFLDEGVFLYNEEHILGIKCRRAGAFEALYLDGYYIHNHIHRKNPDVPLKKKIMATHHSYTSRKYLCRQYYSALLIPWLAFAEFLNKGYLFMAYVHGKIKKFLCRR